MVEVKEEYVCTIRPDRKPGVKIKARWYNSIKEVILEILRRDDVFLDVFMDRLHGRFVGYLGENTGWHLYHVKLDMEARGLIAHEQFKRKRQTLVKLLGVSKRKRGIFPAEHIDKGHIDNVREKFVELYGARPLIVQSPGRVNLMGAHTDYNGGYAMSVPTSSGVQLALGHSNYKHSMVYSIKYDQFQSIDINDPSKAATGHWANLFLGVIQELNTRGFAIRNFNCVFDGNLPSGAGLSSSTAVTCGFVFGLNELFGLKLSQLEMVHVAQFAEQYFRGVRCGVMDQFVNVKGRADHAVFLDSQSLQCDYLPFYLGDYCILLCDTNIKRSSALSDFNLRREECELGVDILASRFPKVTSLRDVSLEMLMENRKMLPDVIFKRCLYIVEENARVLKAHNYFKNGDLSSFGGEMFLSHEGLATYYEVSCPELDYLVDKAKQIQGVLGAKMIGGGFGGCTINLVHCDAVEGFQNEIKSEYRTEFGIEVSTRLVNAGGGVHIFENPVR